MEDIIETKKIGRREFLVGCGVGTLTGLLVGCGGGQSSVAATVTPKISPSGSAVQATSSAQATPVAPDWSTLAKHIQGMLVRPDSAQYAASAQLFSARFDTVHPQAIVYCATPKDVQTSLAFAQQYHIPFAARTGGHSFAGYSTSTGMVLDVTRMNKVTVDGGSGTATIGAGARLIDVYAALTQSGVVLPAGSCPTVGIAGLTLGGGVGVLGRKFGLTCDNLVSAQIVVADGRVLTCDSNTNADLFWALRGGGGGNFGVVTSFQFRVHSVSTLTLFTLSYPWASAVNVVDAWQHWAPATPDEVWSNCLLSTNNDKQASPIVRINGVYVGGVAALNGLLAQLTNRIGVAPTGRYVASVDVLDAMLYEAGCYNKSVAQCHLPAQNPQGQLQRDTSAVKSDYITALLPAQGIQNLVKAVEQRQYAASLGNGGIAMDAYGGAINRVAVDATAFVHRNALFSILYSGSWNASDPESVVGANRDWLKGAWQAMRPYASGASYQNYVDPDLPDWQHAYYGDNLSRLQHIKAAYDPGNLFRFGQSIPPAS